MDWVEEKAAQSIEPERVRLALTSLGAVWPAGFPPLRAVVEDFPAGEKNLLALFAASPISAEKMANDPGALLWLAQPEICNSERGPRRMQRDLDETKNANASLGFDPQFRALRRVKNRAIPRIALRGVARPSSLEQTPLGPSHIAQPCLNGDYCGLRA